MKRYLLLNPSSICLHYGPVCHVAPFTDFMSWRPDAKHMHVYAADKAGMEGIDKDHVAGVIKRLSESSSHYLNEQRKAAPLLLKLEQMQKRIQSTRSEQLQPSRDRCAQVLASALKERKSSQHLRVWCHVDMDMFFAAAAMREDPTLEGRPIAIGGNSMISTANYEARKYGVRSAMPGFIAKELCPDLVFVKHNSELYHSIATQVRLVFADYDPEFHSASLDEASLDLSQYIDAHRDEMKDCASDIEMGGKVAKEIRQRIAIRTRLTASAGVAPNAMLAKICSDLNKPNGQYVLEPDGIDEFMSTLSVRKIPGIGKVMERILAELDCKVCSQIPDIVPVLMYTEVLTERSCQWLLSKSVGLGRVDRVQPHARKSMSMERTFKPISDPKLLEAKLMELCESLAADLSSEQLRGKTVSVKLKLDDYKVLSRSVTLQYSVCTAQELFRNAVVLMRAEFPLSLRLMGVRVSSLENSTDDTMTQTTLEDFPLGIAQDTKTKRKAAVVKTPEEEECSKKARCPICGVWLKLGNSTGINLHIDKCLKQQSNSIIKFMK